MEGIKADVKDKAPKAYVVSNIFPEQGIKFITIKISTELVFKCFSTWFEYVLNVTYHGISPLDIFNWHYYFCHHYGILTAVIFAINDNFCASAL